jgi:hypothetical protein
MLGPPSPRPPLRGTGNPDLHARHALQNCTLHNAIRDGQLGSTLSLLLEESVPVEPQMKGAAPHVHRRLHCVGAAQIHLGRGAVRHSASCGCRFGIDPTSQRGTGIISVPENSFPFVGILPGKSDLRTQQGIYETLRLIQYVPITGWIVRLRTEDRLRAVGCIDRCAPPAAVPPDRDAVSPVVMPLSSQCLSFVTA